MITYPNLYHLKYFAEAVELGSISRAAEKNLVTHPAISRAISALEKHLGIPLLEHQKKSFKVTAAGYQIAKQARLLLSAAADFNSLSLDSKNEEALTLTIGISRTLAELYLSTLLRSVQMKFPTAKIQVRFGTTNEITGAVAQNSLDLGITIGNQNLATLKQSVIKTGKFILVEKAAGKNIPKPFILTEPRFETELLKKNYHNQFGVTLPVLSEISSWEVIGQLVQQGLGTGLLPDITVQSWKKGTFRILKPSWFDAGYEVYVHYPRTPIQNRIQQYALEILTARS